MRILVTGHRGFVGRHMLPLLRRRYPEALIYGIDLKGCDVIGSNQMFTKAGCDIREYFKYTAPDGDFDLVIHLAAVVGGREKIEGAPLDLAVDLAIDAGLFEWALRSRPKKIAYFSSSAAYPIELQEKERAVRLREDDINLENISTPDMTYGWAKLTGEMLAGHARAAGLDVLVLRPFSGYGPDQDLDYPWPSFIKRALARQTPFEIWGDGTQKRDWIHIDDICMATLKALEFNVEGPINLGNGIGPSFLELADMVCSIHGFHPEYRTRPDKPSGVHTRVADPTKMLSFYQPRWGLADAIRKTIADA